MDTLDICPSSYLQFAKIIIVNYLIIISIIINLFTKIAKCKSFVNYVRKNSFEGHRNVQLSFQDQPRYFKLEGLWLFRTKVTFQRQRLSRWIQQSARRSTSFDTMENLELMRYRGVAVYKKKGSIFDGK